MFSKLIIGHNMGQKSFKITVSIQNQIIIKDL
jgi:hypothetical protein